MVGKRSGVYEILIGSEIVEVFCDMKTDEGGWMVGMVSITLAGAYLGRHCAPSSPFDFAF